MLRLAAKSLVVVFALSASPLDALSAIATGRLAAATGEVSVSEALASLATPISEARFFEFLNATNSPGYLVGGAQGGAQMLVVIIRITVPGKTPLLTDTSPLDTLFGLAGGPIDKIRDANNDTLSVNSIRPTGDPDGSTSTTETTTRTTTNPDGSTTTTETIMVRPGTAAGDRLLRRERQGGPDAGRPLRAGRRREAG